jgi:hypothetical protein
MRSWFPAPAKNPTMSIIQLSLHDFRWNGDKTVHVQLTGRSHRTYQAKVESVITKCEDRLEWLKKGSRQLFGTLLESKVVIAIDSSSSLKDRLCLIKTKVQELLQVSCDRLYTLFPLHTFRFAWGGGGASPQMVQLPPQSYRRPLIHQPLIFFESRFRLAV